ncbi:MAG: GNAT family N-acetyltransferase [Pseudomonadota bacterium]|nr:GNAT family N-acetyltransferase [Pseudomonadota bacterium]
MKTTLIRPVERADEGRWRSLWHGYNQFYGADLSDEITNHTWQRLLDPASPLFCRVAEYDGAVAGFVHGVLHEGTWTTAPSCYLEDLFVDPDMRRRGIARLLIHDLTATCVAKGWSRLYWHTDRDNPARALYDKFASADNFVRYRLTFPAARRGE